MLVNRPNKAPTYPRFSLNDLRGLRVPDLGILGQLAEEKLAGAYDELAANVPLPQTDGSRARREMDAAVCATLRLDIGRAAKIRRHLAAEPPVTGKRYEGWHLLSEGAA